MSRGTILLYGHTHNSPEDDYFQKCLVGMKDNGCRHIGDSAIQAYNVGCMKPWMDYEPRSLQEIIKMKLWKMETDNIKTADPARSAVFLCVYEREKHTSIIK